jgi:hypothetical protein
VIVEATIHNTELWVGLATMIGPMAGAQRLISLLELGIMTKVNMPKVCKTICKRTLPYITFIGWGGKPQSQV